VHDPSETFKFGLVLDFDFQFCTLLDKTKSTSVDNIAQVQFMKLQRGQAKLKETHNYYWHVQGQLAVTGLQWCDFVTDTKPDSTIQRIW